MSRLRLKLNAAVADDWLAELSTEFPDTAFRVSATIPTDEGLLGIVEVRTLDHETLVNDLENVSEVNSWEVLYEDDRTVVFQFLSRMTESYGVLLATGIVPQYPISLRDGWFSARLTASRERLSNYLDQLSTTGIPYEIVSLTHFHEPNEVLTERQWQAITKAVECGYYRASRRCTLAELAESLDINESSVSKLLQRAENRIVTEFVAEASS